MRSRCCDAPSFIKKLIAADGSDTRTACVLHTRARVCVFVYASRGQNSTWHSVLDKTHVCARARARFAISRESVFGEERPLRRAERRRSRSFHAGKVFILTWKGLSRPGYFPNAVFALESCLNKRLFNTLPFARDGATNTPGSSNTENSSSEYRSFSLSLSLGRASDPWA